MKIFKLWYITGGLTMHYKEGKNRNQVMIGVSLNYFIDKNNPIRIIDAFIENIVNSEPEEFKYKGQSNIGQKAYSPKTFLKLYIYGYINGITSSRKLEVATKVNIEVKWLLGDLQPDFKTIADYRKDNRRQIDFVSKKIREFLKQHKLIQGELVAIDGTKVKANARRDMLNIKKIRKRLVKIDKRIDDYLEDIEINDLKDDIIEENEDLDSSSINRKLVKKIFEMQKKIERLKQAEEKLKQSDKKQISMTDKDASLVKMKGGKVPGYNIQAAVDAKNMMIMGIYPTDAPVDTNQLCPLVNHLEKEYNEVPESITADKGYYNLNDITKIKLEKDIDFYTPLPNKKIYKEKIEFKYDKEKDEYICSEGKSLKLIQKNKKHHGAIMDVYRCDDCDGCPRRGECTKSKYGRMKHRYRHQELRDDFKRKMRTKKAKKIVAKRKAIVEHVFGTIKYWMGQIPLKLRGLKKVGTEINIYATGYNIKRLINTDSIDSILENINKYDWKMA